MVQKPGATNQKPPIAANSNNEFGQHSSGDQAVALNAMFMSMALEMSWQLAIVVIVPIVGGHFADSWLHTSPWLTLTGFILALLGVVGVLWRLLAEANRRSSGIVPKGRQ